MAEPQHVAGKSTREMAARRRRRSLMYLGGALALCVAMYALARIWRPTGWNGLFVFLGALIALKMAIEALGARSQQLDKAEARAERGAVAEEQVGGLLDALGPEYLALHDIPCQYGNIDHLVIGAKCGLVLLETKSHHGKVTADGNGLQINGKAPEKDFIQQALRNALWLRNETEKVLGFKPWVTATVVFTNAFVSVRQPIEGVWAINSRYLGEFLQNNKGDPARVSAIWEARDRIREQL